MSSTVELNYLIYYNNVAGHSYYFHCTGTDQSIESIKSASATKWSVDLFTESHRHDTLAVCIRLLFEVVGYWKCQFVAL